MGFRQCLGNHASWLAISAGLVAIGVPAMSAQAADQNITTNSPGTISLAVGDNLSISSTGTISQAAVSGAVTIGDITNDGVITGVTNGIVNASGTIGTVTNTGQIKGTQNGVSINSGDINYITNSGTITGTGNTGVRMGAGGSIGTLSNAAGGTITGGSSGILLSSSTIGTLTNAGFISGTFYGVFGFGTINAIDNSGTISGQTGIRTNGVIGSLANSGTITGTNAGIFKYGPASTISTVTNSGTISGATAAFNVSTGAIDTIANTGVIAGNINISTGADVTFTGGSGTVVGTLTGYTAGTTGTITAGDVTFLSGAMLLEDNINASSGTGTVTNSGTLYVNKAINVTGNYSQSSSGTLVIGVSNATYGQIVVSGSAALAGQVKIVEISTGAIEAGDTFTIINASGGSTGTFSTISITGANYSTVTSGDGSSISIMSGSSGGSPLWQSRGQNAGQASLGQALDALSNDAAYSDMLTKISALSSSGQTRAMQQLAPAVASANMSNSLALSGPVTQAVQNRQVAQLDSGANMGAAAGSGVLSSGIWGQFLGGRSELEGSALKGGYGANYVGFLVGADTAPSENTTVGVAVSTLYGKTKGSDAASGQDTNLTSYALSFYGTWRPDGEALYFEGEAGAAYDTYEQNRKIDFSSQVATSEYDGQHYNLRVGGGYDIPLSAATTVTPLTSFSLAYVNTESYGETGAGVANLHINQNSFHSVEGEIGARLSQEATTPFGPVTLDVKAALVHDFTGDPISLSASIGGIGFVSSSDRPDENGVRLGLGSTLLADDGLSLRLQYDGDFRSDYKSHNGMFILRQEF
ncbi:autotransporter outer membrane beta-barrel domain-containing protein [Thalassospira alkalitolerans]|uniref:Autotransporter domain-containing protein n=1 Tax=Thalassospira alkalitolerans TaxID=1293890 RepID=A0A1Y2L5J9_9PROT|nr:autotransporter outer membrane beta-barrel domain-containing protein [Thalassospira alkalitolerans]OSQ42357.1 hypothetical protein TALK_21675 [Thalassospira alkalitolerans]